jgi:hypothetical protein
MSGGVSCFFGVTTSGKTSLALEKIKADIARDGRASLILDCMPARNLKAFHHEHSVDAVIERLYAEGTHACYTPSSEEDLEKLFKAVHAAGTAGAPIHVLWDEASLHQSPQHIADGIEKALRGWQHSDNSIAVVTQRPADLHGIVFACLPEVYCFRLERGADLKRVQDELSLDPEKIRVLNQGQFEVYSRDRFKKVTNERVGTGTPANPSGHADPVHAGEVQQQINPISRPLSQGMASGGRRDEEGTPRVA